MVEYLSGGRIQGSSAASGGTIDGTGLKAYWKLAGNYTSNPQTETNVASTITGNNTLGTDADMIIHNSPTQVTSGTPSGLGNANSFDGSSDFGRAGDNADVGQWQFMHNTSGLFTMNWWFKFDDGEPPANEFIWDSSDATDSQPATRISTLASEEWRLMVTRTGGNNAVFDTNDASIDCEIPTDDAWHMYTMTWDYNNTPNFTYRVDGATSGTYYVTANKNGNYSAIDGNSDYAPYFMRSGYQASGGTGGTYGHIDGDVMEMSIWNRVLTNAEITHISASGNGLTLENTTIGTTDEKAAITDVPVGTRYEETDTRKIFGFRGATSGSGDVTWDTATDSGVTISGNTVTGTSSSSNEWRDRARTVEEFYVGGGLATISWNCAQAGLLADNEDMGFGSDPLYTSGDAATYIDYRMHFPDSKAIGILENNVSKGTNFGTWRGSQSGNWSLASLQSMTIDVAGVVRYYLAPIGGGSSNLALIYTSLIPIARGTLMYGHAALKSSGDAIVDVTYDFPDSWVEKGTA